ncbi:MAG TPA: AsmA-like C-terminal region-containing protein [Myxococcota bacterium]|nr:AsmA-like C-terminal region-containing protein [Myxococcota bacterium]
MRRVALLLGAFALFAAATLAGFRAASRWLPEAVRVAAQSTLTTALGTEVGVGAVHLLYGPSIAIEARDLSAWPTEWGPALRVDRADISVHWLDLLFGRIDLQRVELSGLSLRIRRGPDGGLEPRALAEWVLRAEGALQAAPSLQSGAHDNLGPVRAVIHRLRALVLPELDLEVHLASISLADPRLPGGMEQLTGLNLELLEGGFRRDLELHAEARLSDAKGPRGVLAAELRRDYHSANTHAVVTATDLDLAMVSAELDALGPGFMSGRLTGALDVSIVPRAPADRRTELELDARVSELALPVAPGAGAAADSRLHIDHANLRATVRAERQRIVLAGGRIGLSGKEFDVSGTLGRPLTPEARVELTLRTEKLSLDDARKLVAMLPPHTREGFQRAMQPVEGGGIDALEGSASAPFARWQELARGELAALPPDATLTGFVRDLAIHLDSGDRLEGVSGVMIWRADELALRGIQARLHGSALPQLNLAIAGLSNLRDARNPSSPPPPAVGPLEGRIPLFAMLASDPGEQNLPPRWKELAIDADAVDHPALGWPLEGAHVVITPTQDGVHFRGDQGRWGGIPIRFEGSWLNKPERLTLKLSASPVAGGPPPTAAADFWARGRFVYQAAPVFPADPHPSGIAGVSGSFRIQGERLEVSQGEMQLRPGGVIRGESSFDFSRSDGIPFKAQVSFEQATVHDLALMLGQTGEHATGKLTAHGVLESVLAPYVPLFAHAEGDATVRATDGELRAHMPLFVSIASVSETLNPFASRDRIRYRQVAAALRFHAGRVSTEALTIDSPDLRVVASGEVALLPPHEVKAVVALLFFGKVSNLVGMLPVLNTILLGKENSLMGAYFQVSGTFAEPEVKLVPSKSLTGSGPAQLLLEGIPSFVRSGVEAIQSVLGRRAAPPEPSAQLDKRTAPAPEGM